MPYDDVLLGSLEKISTVLRREVEDLKSVKSIHARQFRAWMQEIQDYARIFEEISLPARLIVEHILELRFSDGRLAVETPSIKQEWAPIQSLHILEFGVLTLKLDNLEVSWRDSDYNAFFYPDKVELRTADEKSFIKLFFSRNFARQTQADFAGLSNMPRVLYVHPSLLESPAAQAQGVCPSMERRINVGARE